MRTSDLVGKEKSSKVLSSTGSEKTGPSLLRPVTGTMLPCHAIDLRGRELPRLHSRNTGTVKPRQAALCVVNELSIDEKSKAGRHGPNRELRSAGAASPTSEELRADKSGPGPIKPGAIAELPGRCHFCAASEVPR